MIKVNGATVLCNGKGKELLNDYIRVTMATKSILGEEAILAAVGAVLGDMIKATEVKVDLGGLQHEKRD